MCVEIHTEGPPHPCRNISLVHIAPASLIIERDLPLQMEAH